MYDETTRASALEAIRAGNSLLAVSKLTGISRATLREWRGQAHRSPDARRSSSVCPRCRPEPELPEPQDAYAYLLGQYLGDGCLSSARRDVWALRIACADSWPGIRQECAGAIRQLRPGRGVAFARRKGYTMVTATWKHWPCLFPQHEPGKKHTRRIELVPWQQQLVRDHAGQFLRGLFHSDGCRITNWTRREVAGVLKRYEYPRYLFSNESADILDLCGGALDRLDVEHRRPRRNVISIARRGAVATLDGLIGPKS